jgi:diguanylate cyclase (GGDEF)-like protein
MAALAAVAGLLSVFALDQATGASPVQHLYYLPLTLAAVTFGFRGGVLASLVAILFYHLANPRLLTFGHQHWDFVQVTLFLAVGIITAKLAQDRRRLHLLAITDDLTGLHNLRSFEDLLAGLVRSSRAENAPLALLALDVDRLKSLNDAHGHLAGAEAVRTVGHIIAGHLPDDAVACRYGGDEFVIAVPRCSESAAHRVAEEIRQSVFGTSPVLAGLPFPVQTLSVSVGVISQVVSAGGALRSDAEIGEDLFSAADAALYRAKKSGRNLVCAS